MTRMTQFIGLSNGAKEFLETHNAELVTEFVAIIGIVSVIGLVVAFVLK